MRYAGAVTLSKIIILGALASLIGFLVFMTPPREDRSPLAGVPQSGAGSSLPGPKETWMPPPLGQTPTSVAPTATAAVEELQPAVLVTPVIITEAVLSPQTSLSIGFTANSDATIRSWAWAPTGDKLIYVTSDGNLYWSGLDGKNATLLHSYSSYRNAVYLLDDQRPMGNTLFVRHRGATTSQDHLDIIQFTPGQPPVLQEVYPPGVLFDITWWSADRVSGVRTGGARGTEKLVTMNASGQVLEQRNIPHMLSGVVKPGGGWLAYVSSNELVDVPIPAYDPGTAYILNLSTNTRIQITSPGKARRVHSWSPDGQWVLLDARIGTTCGAALVSLDGLEAIVIPQGCGHYLFDANWSPNSRRLAFSVRTGGCDAEGPCATPLTSQVYIVDVPNRQITEPKEEGLHLDDPDPPAQMMQPKWSPDGSTLGFLSFDAQCSNGDCSGLAPAFYFMPSP